MSEHSVDSANHLLQHPLTLFVECAICKDLTPMCSEVHWIAVVQIWTSLEAVMKGEFDKLFSINPCSVVMFNLVTIFGFINKFGFTLCYIYARFLSQHQKILIFI